MRPIKSLFLTENSIILLSILLKCKWSVGVQVFNHLAGSINKCYCKRKGSAAFGRLPYSRQMRTGKQVVGCRRPFNSLYCIHLFCQLKTLRYRHIRYHEIAPDVDGFKRQFHVFVVIGILLTIVCIMFSQKFKKGFVFVPVWMHLIVLKQFGQFQQLCYLRGTKHVNRKEQYGK